MVDKWHDYLYGMKFEVRIDKNPLTYMLASAKLDAVGYCWLVALSTYDLSLKYRSGFKTLKQALSPITRTHTDSRTGVERRIHSRCESHVSDVCGD